MKTNEYIIKESDHFATIQFPIVEYTIDSYEEIRVDLVKIIDELELWLKTNKGTSETSDGLTNTRSILTGHFSKYNILDYAESYSTVERLKQFINDAYFDYVEKYLNASFEVNKVQCWANKLSHLDWLDKHAHTFIFDSSVSANFFVDSNCASQTLYHVPIMQNHFIPLENKPGTLTFFGSIMYHETTSQRSTYGHRYSLGLDFYHEKSQAAPLHLPYVDLQKNIKYKLES